MVKLVYTTDLKSVGRKPLWVRVPPPAPRRKLQVGDYATAPIGIWLHSAVWIQQIAVDETYI